MKGERARGGLDNVIDFGQSFFLEDCVAWFDTGCGSHGDRSGSDVGRIGFGRSGAPLPRNSCQVPVSAGRTSRPTSYICPCNRPPTHAYLVSPCLACLTFRPNPPTQVCSATCTRRPTSDPRPSIRPPTRATRQGHVRQLYVARYSMAWSDMVPYP